MSKIKIAIAAPLAALALAACGPTTTFEPDVQARIDAKDCATLQDWFDAADVVGNTDGMVMYDDAMRVAGCYR